MISDTAFERALCILACFLVFAAFWKVNDNISERRMAILESCAQAGGYIRLSSKGLNRVCTIIDEADQ